MLGSARGVFWYENILDNFMTVRSWLHVIARTCISEICKEKHFSHRTCSCIFVLNLIHFTMIESHKCSIVTGCGVFYSSFSIISLFHFATWTFCDICCCLLIAELQYHWQAWKSSKSAIFLGMYALPPGTSQKRQFAKCLFSRKFCFLPPALLQCSSFAGGPWGQKHKCQEKWQFIFDLASQQVLVL